MRHLRDWIAGRRARIMRGSATAPRAAAGMLGLKHYNADLEELAARYNCWRLRGEGDRDLAFRTAVEIATRLQQLEQDLDCAINFNKLQS